MSKVYFYVSVNQMNDGEKEEFQKIPNVKPSVRGSEGRKREQKRLNGDKDQ